jgi:hypothetical protein
MMFLIIILHARIIWGEFWNGEGSGKLVESGIEGRVGKKRGNEKKVGWSDGNGGIEGERMRKRAFFGWNFGFFGSAGVDLCGYGISG